MQYEEAAKLSISQMPRLLFIEDCDNLSSEDINWQLLLRKKLINELLGSLYKDVLFNEITSLRKLYIIKAGRHDYWG